jgi:hypothetical protein
MNNLSANTVFHFTNSITNLKGILQNNFYPSYCLEPAVSCLSRPILKGRMDMATPMVCFCDIPLSQIKDHTGKYGCYAIGLSKEWAMKHKVNPIIYTYYKSKISDIYSDHILSYVNYCILEENKNEVKPVINLLAFIKPYKGDLWKNGKIVRRDVRFYDEREWRFVPKIEEDKKLFLQKPDYLNVENKNQHNNKLKENKNYHLVFSPKDIRYIIVKKENELLDIIDFITKIKRDNFTDKDVRILLTRIISMQMVVDDF